MGLLKEFQKVAKVGDLDDGDMVAVQAERHDFLLVRIGDEYFGVDLWCTHADAQLDQGFLYYDRCEVQCPLHESRFDLRTGEVTGEPAEVPIPLVAVRVEGDDILMGPLEGE